MQAWQAKSRRGVVCAAGQFAQLGQVGAGEVRECATVCGGECYSTPGLREETPTHVSSFCDTLASYRTLETDQVGLQRMQSAAH